jgi:phosphoribosylformylglycinamidine synthase
MAVEGRTVAALIASGAVPAIDLNRERAVQETCLAAAEAGLLQSAHDCSDGGLAVSLAESCFSSLNREALGVDLKLSGTLPTVSLLFAESPSRIVVSFRPEQQDAVATIAQQHEVPFSILGTAGGKQLRVAVNDEVVIDHPIADLEAAWRNSLPKKLEAQVMAASKE